MGLETGTYIDSLNTSNPGATDSVAQGDDHIRLLTVSYTHLTLPTKRIV